MKFVVIFGLCLVATTLATPLSPNLRLRRQVATANPTCSNATGLVGLLQQVGNLVGNLLDNAGRLRIRNLLAENGDTRTLLLDLLRQVEQIVNGLLSNPNTSDSDSNQRQGELGTLLNQITELLNNLLGTNEASSWPCTNSTGILGRILTSLFGALGNLTGLTSSDGGLLTEVLTVVLQLVGSVLRLLL